MEQFFDHVLLETEYILVTVLAVFSVTLVIFIALAFSWMLRKLVVKAKAGGRSVSDFAKRLFMILNLAIWLVAAVVVFLILGLPFKDAMDYKIIDGDNFSIKPVHFILGALVIVGTRILLMGLEKLVGLDSIITSGDSSRKKNVLKFFTYIIWVISFLLILNLTGLNLTVFLGAGAALLVGIGFGLQQIFADLISGIFLLFEGNLREGDVVELNNGTIGRVTFIGGRTSKVKTRDNVVLIIPNSHFISQEVINWSHIETQTRFDVGVGVAYGSDVQLVKKVLLDCADDHPDISRTPKPFVRFQDFGDSSLDFSLYFWTAKTFLVENLKSDIRFAIEKNFRENNIQIPFPQRDVHMIK